MLRSHLAIATCLASALLSLAGCGSTETPAEPGDDNSRVGLPPLPGPEKAGDGPGVVLGINKLYLGETDRDGTTNKASGWKQYGFNLDGKVSDTSSKDLCKPAAGGVPSSIYPDGNDGIDNSFGKNILSIILGIEAAPSVAVSDSIAEGSFTIMLKIDGLGADADYNPLTTKLYGGGDLGAPAKFDGTDQWPVLPELLNDPSNIDSAKVVFPKSYVVGNTWVSGGQGDLNLNLSVAGYSLGLTIGGALIAMDMDEDHKGAVNGTIAGVLETEVLITELQKIVGAFQPSLCEGSTIEGILNQIRQASDIMKDGTQDPNKECDGISIGIGFSAKEVQLGAIAPPAGPADDPCAMPQPGG